MKLPRSGLQLLVLYLLPALSAVAQPGAASAEQALRDLRQAANPPPVPLPAAGKKRTKQEGDALRAQQAAAYVAAAAKAHDFQTRFPADAHVAEARKLEAMSLLHALRFGDTADEAHATAVANAFVADTHNSRRDRYVVAANLKQWQLVKQGPKDRAATFAVYQKNAADLYADFSDVPEVYHLFLGLARNAPTIAESRAIAADLLTKPAPAEVKAEAQAVLDRLDLPGRKLDLKFVVNNGTIFDLAQHKGAPVVIYFWTNRGRATTAAMPLLRQAAANDNVVFIGVNLDDSPLAEKTAPDGQPPPGPQRWEPLGLSGAVPQQLRVNQVPSTYVFDADGVLVGFGHPRELAALLARAAAPGARRNP